MINKVVDANGTITFMDSTTAVAALSTKVDRDSNSAHIAVSGALRTDIQAYLNTEFQFYEAAGLASVELDCGEVTQISPGCFWELLDMKIQLGYSGGRMTVSNKPECILGMERRTGKTL